MVDVGGDNGTTGSYFVAHKFRCDIRFDTEGLIIGVLAYGHIFHFRSDDSGTGKGHLSDAATFAAAERSVGAGETY